MEYYFRKVYILIIPNNNIEVKYFQNILLKDWGNSMSDEIKYVECIDLNDEIIKLPENSSYYYTEDDKNYTIRYDFKKVFGTIENYMRTGYEALNLDEFDIQQLKNDEFNGTFIHKIVLNDSTVLKHYYTFIGYENENVIKVAPVKIPKKNFFVVNTTEIVSNNWYYLESNDDMEYIE